MRRLVWLVWLLWVVSILPWQNTYGWDTNIKAPYQGWLSIYNANGKTLQQEAEAEDEHTALSDWALRALGAGLYSYNQNPIVITDLNASYFRRALLGKQGSYLHGPYSLEKGMLEKRQLPAPSQFSGLPDYSYTLYDWINKNVFCPPKKGLEGCHRFEGWMGILNANHFGTQAANSYWRLHQLAINLAKHARDIRKNFSKDPNALDAYGEFVREAEREALSVEGYAQHFLQDRWSMGHMWERWNAPDYSQLADRSFTNNLMVAAFSGLLHGYEGSLGMPDALSSPQVPWTQTGKNYLWRITPKYFKVFWGTENELLIPHWKQNGDKRQRGNSFDGFPGVGDFRFLDMLDNHFGKEYKSVGRDYPLSVGAQKSMMQQCLMAGWAEVIRAFGKNPAGGFGSESVSLREDIKGFSSLGFRCDDQWATNASIALGWFDNVVAVAAKDAAKDQDHVFGYYARLILAYKSKGLGEAVQAAIDRGGLYIQRRALLRVTWNINMFGRKLKQYLKETNLARATVNLDFGLARTGNHYRLPDYIEPATIDQLADDGPAGKDKKSWFGFFNRSHADYWCGSKGIEVLRELRGSADPEKQAVCEYLADRFYQGTDPLYKGYHQEKRTADHTESGKPLHSVCYFFGARKLWNPNTPDEVPFFLSGGYVSNPYARPNRTSRSYQTVSNWCARAPVLQYVLEKNGEVRDDVVAKVQSWDDPVVLKGEDLGEGKGKLWLDCQQFGSVHVPDDHIKRWTKSRIEMDMTWLPDDRRKENTHSICVETVAGKRSVGSFYIRREAPSRRLRLEGVWEAREPGNHWRMRVHYEKAQGKYIGVLVKHGKISKEVGFSLGEKVFSAMPAKDWHGVAVMQKWRRGQDGRSTGREWRSTELDMSRSTNDRLVTKGEYVYVRVKIGQTGATQPAR